MKVIERHPWAALALATGLALAVVVLAAVLTFPDDTTVATPPGPGPGAEVTTPRTPGAGTTVDDPSEGEAAAGSVASRTTSSLGADALGPGFPGEGGTAGLTPRRVDMSASSSGKIGIVGYVVPTSRDDSHAVVKGVGSSWARSTNAYGDPDYARVFVQSGFEGTPVTCTIRVDGVVRDRRTTEGPYGQAMCQG